MYCYNCKNRISSFESCAADIIINGCITPTIPWMVLIELHFHYVDIRFLGSEKISQTLLLYRSRKKECLLLFSDSVQISAFWFLVSTTLISETPFSNRSPIKWGLNSNFSFHASKWILNHLMHLWLSSTSGRVQFSFSIPLFKFFRNNPECNYFSCR